MRRLFALALGLTIVPETAWEQSGNGPAFSDFPATGIYAGPVAKPLFQAEADNEYLLSVFKDEPGQPNFAGHYKIVRFRAARGHGRT
jgi:hypothetical protein